MFLKIANFAFLNWKLLEAFKKYIMEHYFLKPIPKRKKKAIQENNQMEPTTVQKKPDVSLVLKEQMKKVEN